MDNHDYEVEKASQLTADLQKAALNLIKHLGTNNFRMRIEGSTPALYITLSEGRSSYSADSVIFHAPQAGAQALAPNSTPSATPNAAPVAVPDTAQVATQGSAEQTPLLARFSRLRRRIIAA
jgi:hypothetical protein